jgi:hypothetical protein
MLFACLFANMVLSDSPFTKLSSFSEFPQPDRRGIINGTERGLPASAW